MIYADEHVNEEDAIDEAQNSVEEAGDENKIGKARKQTQLLERCV